MERVSGVSEHGLRDSGGAAGVLAEAPYDRHWVQVREAERNNVERSSAFYGFADPRKDLPHGTPTTRRTSEAPPDFHTGGRRLEYQRLEVGALLQFNEPRKTV